MSASASSEERQVDEDLAKKINGEAWSLLEKADRTAEDDERMVLAAHASTYHWLRAGTNAHRQPGEWMLAHVYTLLGREEPARHHARRCLAFTSQFADDMKDFDLAYADEAVARGSAGGRRRDGPRPPPAGRGPGRAHRRRRGPHDLHRGPAARALVRDRP